MTEGISGQEPMAQGEPMAQDSTRIARSVENAEQVLVGGLVVGLFLADGLIDAAIFLALIAGLWRACHRRPEGFDEAWSLFFIVAATIVAFTVSRIAASLLWSALAYAFGLPAGH